MVALKHRPTQASQAATKVGSTEGMVIRRRIFHRLQPNNRAISSSCRSVEAMPSRRLAYTTGVTMSMPARMGTLEEDSHTSARMMKEATGVARTTASAGRISSSSRADAWLSPASTQASATPSP